MENKLNTRSNVIRPTQRHSRRTMRMMTIVTGAAMALFASVQATTAQPAPSTRPANSMTAPQNASGAKGDIIGEGTDSNGRIHLAVNKSTVITTKVPYKTVSVGQADIADVNMIGP